MVIRDDSESDWYAILGVAQSATPQEIRSAHPRLAGDYHSDRLQNVSAAVRALAEAKLREINAAKDVLLDAHRRAEYDEGCRWQAEAARSDASAHRQQDVPPQPSPTAPPEYARDEPAPSEPNHSGRTVHQSIFVVVPLLVMTLLGIAVRFLGSEYREQARQPAHVPTSTKQPPARNAATEAVVPPLGLAPPCWRWR